MKSILPLSLLPALALVISPVGLRAQDKPVDERPVPTRTDVKPIQKHPIKIGERQNRLRSSAVTSVDVPERAQPAELKSLIERFKLAREKYLQDREAMLRQLKEATDEQRDELREQMRDALEVWREMQAELRVQVAERKREIREQLSQDLERVVETGSQIGDGRRPRE